MAGVVSHELNAESHSESRGEHHALICLCQRQSVIINCADRRPLISNSLSRLQSIEQCWPAENKDRQTIWPLEYPGLYLLLEDAMTERERPSVVVVELLS